MRTLFPVKDEPKITTVDMTEEPVPGPNAFEVAVLSYDPDAGLLHIRMANDVTAYIRFEDLDPEGANVDFQLNDSKIGPQLRLTARNVTLPKFSTPEEAEAWLEANS